MSTQSSSYSSSSSDVSVLLHCARLKDKSDLSWLYCVSYVVCVDVSCVEQSLSVETVTVVSCCIMSLSIHCTDIDGVDVSCVVQSVSCNDELLVSGESIVSCKACSLHCTETDEYCFCTGVMQLQQEQCVSTV